MLTNSPLSAAVATFSETPSTFSDWMVGLVFSNGEDIEGGFTKGTWGTLAIAEFMVEVVITVAPAGLSTNGLGAMAKDPCDTERGIEGSCDAVVRANSWTDDGS